MAERTHAQAQTAATQEHAPGGVSVRQQPTRAPLLQRKCGCSAEGSCEKCGRGGLLQRKADGGAASAFGSSTTASAFGSSTTNEGGHATAPEGGRGKAEGGHAAAAEGGRGRAAEGVPAVVSETLQAAGQPLDSSARSLMEARFGHDFSRVRVHTGARASESARAVGAHAYTVGSRIVFGAGQYAPATPSGRHLLAHELAHVVQQGGAAPDLQKLSIAGEAEGAHEHEADLAAEAVALGHSVRVAGRAAGGSVQRQPAGAAGPFLTADAAGGCGICFRGNVRAVGNSAHAQIQTEFEVMYPMLNSQFPIQLRKQTHKISKGIPDLVLPTPTGFEVGEIKPANPEGYIEGEAKLVIYEKLLQERYKKINPTLTVGRLAVAPPTGLTFVEPASLTCTQTLIVNPSVRGVYGYLCHPPFSYSLRKRCRCEGDKEPKDVPLPVPKGVKETGKEGEKEKGKEGEKEKGKEKEKGRAPGPEVLVPVAAAAALLAAAKFLGKKAAGRVLAPATVAAALVLVANGAEASVGLEGDDPLEALFKMSADKGTPIPDDLKDAIKKDPALSRMLSEAARSGDFTAAQKQLGVELTRVIVENREQFTEEELQELLTAVEGNQGAIPNGPVTAETLRLALEAKRAGATPGGKGAGGGGATPGAGGTKDEGTPATPPAGAGAATGPALTGPAKRLAEALLKESGDGPKVDAAGREKLNEVLRSAAPPLTDAEVDTLLTRLASAKGRTLDEVLESVRTGITEMRTPKPPEGAPPKPGAGEPGGGGAEQGGAKKDETNAPGQAAGLQPQIEDPEKSRPKPKAEDAQVGPVYSEFLAKGTFNSLANGRTVVTWAKGTVLKEGLTVNAFMAGRWHNGALYGGMVKLSFVKKLGDLEWNATLYGGSRLYTEDGSIFSTTKGGSVTITLGARQ